MLTGLGMTETAPFAICANAEEVKSGHIGLPAPGMELKLVPTGDKVEVRYRGPNVTPGYWRAPEQTDRVVRRRRLLLQRRCGQADRCVEPEAAASCSTAAPPRTSSSRPAPSSRSARCARKIIAAGDPCVQDVVVAGINRDQIGALIFPRLDACRAYAQLPASCADARRARGAGGPRLLPAPRRRPVGERHRQRDAGGARHRAGRPAEHRPRRDHRQGLDQPACGADAPRLRSSNTFTPAATA